MIDDIDIFPFPVHAIKAMNMCKDNSILELEDRERLRNIRFMRHKIKMFVEKLKSGKAKFPRVIDIMVTLRKERLRNNLEINEIRLGNYNMLRMLFDIDDIYNQFCQETVKDRLREMLSFQIELQDIQDINSPSTIYTFDDSKQFSIKCKSFHTVSHRSIASKISSSKSLSDSLASEIAEIKD